MKQMLSPASGSPCPTQNGGHAATRRGAQRNGLICLERKAGISEEDEDNSLAPQWWRCTCHMVTIFFESKIGIDDLTPGLSMGPNI